MLRPLVLAAALIVPAVSLAAQQPATSPDSATFIVMHGADTMITEHFLRTDRQVLGELDRRAVARRETYKALLTPDGTVPLVEFAVWASDDPSSRTPRQRVRVIFKDDSVAVDEVNSAEMMTRTFESQKGAIPYLNLSFVLLEQATRRLAQSGADSLPVPFFNLNGGQTAVGMMRRVGADSASLQLGTVGFQLHLDKEGRLLGAAIPAQGVTAERARKS
ncbi:MAG: hypothetical protein ABI765_10975 [Gemmatimonadota bacterium]